MSVAAEDRLTELIQNQSLRHYKDHTAFFYGRFSAAVASLLSFLLTSHWGFLISSLMMGSIMLAEISNIRWHKQLLKNERTDYDEWQRQYNILSTGFMFFIGCWAFLSFVLTNDIFLHLLAVAVTMGNIFNIVCRNFSGGANFTYQLSASAIPLVAGFLTYADYRGMILCAFFIPLLTSLRDIAMRLRNLFANIEEESYEKELFGTQLNTALESMSHGLIMFDAEMRLRVINEMAKSILDLNSYINCYGKTLYEISQLMEDKRPLYNRVRILESTLRRRLKRDTTDRVFKLSPTQYVELSIKLREEGGCVLVIEDVTQRIQYQTRINQLAKFDELTGLSNRSFFLHQAKSTLEGLHDGDTGAILFFDLDDFKRVNDTMGHEAGDFILTSVAERVKRILPPEALAARYGGDEFVIMINSAQCKISIDELAKTIIDEIPADLFFNNQKIRFGASLGVAQFPKDSTSLERLLKVADLALYEAKDAGKNTYRYFSKELEETLSRRVQIESDLAKAVKQEAFELHFQPLVNINNGKTQVFEALTRWKRNKTEFVSPAEFIPIAEDLGLIREIGEWTLFEACRQCKSWPKGVNVAVNMSAVQFQVGSVTDAVSRALTETGLDPERLEIEVTETAVLNDMTHAIMVLESLSDMGVSISLDDFGTGYSSLSYLHKLPLNKLKIDKAFVDDFVHSERSRTLLKGITALGRALDLKVVVEGVETKQQFDLLKAEYDIDLVQGFYFSKALAPSKAREYAERNRMENATKLAEEIDQMPHIGNSPRIGMIAPGLKMSAEQ